MANLIAIFNSSQEAGNAVAELKQGDFTEEISVVTSEFDENTFDAEKKRIKQDIDDGAAAGAAGGAILGLLAGLAAIPIPGTELLAVGALGTTIATTAAGTAGGALVGALVDYGIDETNAKEYADYIIAGQVLVAVSTDSEEQTQTARATLENYSPKELAVIED